MAWVTCLKCGGRWERIFDGPNDPEMNGLIYVKEETRKPLNNPSAGYSEGAKVDDPAKKVIAKKSLVVTHHPPEPVGSAASSTASASQYSISTPRDPSPSKRRNPEIVAIEATQELDQKVLFNFQQGCAQGHSPAETITEMIRNAKDIQTIEAVQRLTRTLSST